LDSNQEEAQQHADDPDNKNHLQKGEPAPQAMLKHGRHLHLETEKGGDRRVGR
jgi:hypothetical protein